MSDDLEKRVRKLETRVDELESGLREALRILAVEQIAAFQEKFQEPLQKGDGN